MGKDWMLETRNDSLEIAERISLLVVENYFRPEKIKEFNKGIKSLQDNFLNEKLLSLPLAQFKIKVTKEKITAKATKQILADHLVGDIYEVINSFIFGILDFEYFNKSIMTTYIEGEKLPQKILRYINTKTKLPEDFVNIVLITLITREKKIPMLGKVEKSRNTFFIKPGKKAISRLEKLRKIEQTDRPSNNAKPAPSMERPEYK